MIVNRGRGVGISEIFCICHKDDLIKKFFYKTKTLDMRNKSVFDLKEVPLL